jgi:RNA polymerase sigma-70 factor (ECF subfamily)
MRDVATTSTIRNIAERVAMSGTLVSEPTDESALIASLRAGDQAAFAGLVDRHTPAWRRRTRSRFPQQAAGRIQALWPLSALLKEHRFTG